MPELPDVEVYRQYLARTSLHQKIHQVTASSPKLIWGTSAEGLRRKLHHGEFESADRHGKYLFARLDRGGCLAMHFGMTGTLQYWGNGDEAPRYSAVQVDFENGHHLGYISRRKLGFLAWLETPDELIGERELGVDALKITERDFLRLASGRKQVKAWLMDQSKIAGIGNVYSDEILFQAGIHPKDSLDDLGEKHIKGLFRAMNRVLKEAIRAEADPDRMPRDFLLPRRKQGARCPRCDASVASTKAAGRTAWYCPDCQKPRGR